MPAKSIDLVDIKDRFIALLFPERCVLCGEVVAYDDMWCGKCGYNKLGKIDCGEFPHDFADALAGAEYSGTIRQAVWRIKDRSDKRTLRFFAGLMCDSMQSHWSDIRFDMIVPVPISPSRLEKRGFNQAERLGAYLSRLTLIPMQSGVLLQHDDSKVQHTLTKAERWINAEKAFDILNAQDVMGKTVLLVDDVFTTGATLCFCSGKLIQAGAKSVYCIAAAKTCPDADESGEAGPNTGEN